MRVTSTLTLLVSLLALAALGACGQGTRQLPGVDGTIGKPATLGKESPLLFTLISANFTVTRVSTGEHSYFPAVTEKLLVIHFAVQNPAKTTDRQINSSSLRFTVVDQANISREPVSFIGAAPKIGAAVKPAEILDVTLKPTQKVEGFIVFKVPAKGVVPKLIVQPEDEESPVIRYDLRTIVTALPAPFADPADKTGATVRPVIPAAMNTAYPFGPFDMKVESTGFETKTLADYELEDGNHFFVVTMSITNRLPIDYQTHWSAFKPILTVEGGDTVEWSGNILKGTLNQLAETTMKPGTEIRIRLFMQIPKDAKPKSLSLCPALDEASEESDGIAYLYDLAPKPTLPPAGAK